MLHEGDGYVGGDELVAHSEQGVGVDHLLAWVDVYLYVSYGFCFEQILIIVNIHLNYNNKSLNPKYSQWSPFDICHLFSNNTTTTR